MVICFECSPETRTQLDALVEIGQYQDYSDAIKVAIANQLLLHGKVATDRSLVLADESNTGATPSASKKSERQMVAIDYTAKKIVEPSIPAVFQLNGKPSSQDSAPLPDDVWSGMTSVPLERWVFGQYNKLFPLKASCRALANNPWGKNLLTSPDHVAQRIATDAVELGRYLLHHDLQHSIPRDDRLSTAFPTPDPASEKSRDRYAKQFVINVNRSGQLSSLLVDYKFVNFTREKNARLLLTEPGWVFALLRNPVLDHEQQDPAERFNQRERDFLVEHIISYVPVERVAYRIVLNAVSKGQDTPDKLGVALQAYVKDRDAYTPSYLAAQRSGAVSRMADLGLLTRMRDGVRVTYKTTNAGDEFLNRASKI